MVPSIQRVWLTDSGENCAKFRYYPEVDLEFLAKNLRPGVKVGTYILSDQPVIELYRSAEETVVATTLFGHSELLERVLKDFNPYDLLVGQTRIYSMSGTEYAPNFSPAVDNRDPYSWDLFFRIVNKIRSANFALIKFDGAIKSVTRESLPLMALCFINEDFASRLDGITTIDRSFWVFIIQALTKIYPDSAKSILGIAEKSWFPTFQTAYINMNRYFDLVREG